MVRVVYIGGAGRSGSTLLDRVIGQIPGYVSAGEVRAVWQAGVGENRLCGCGLPFQECPFWGQVGEHAFGAWSALDADAIERALDSMSYLDALRCLVGRSPLPPAVAAIAPQIEQLYRAISSAAGDATIIDSSKGPRYAVILSLLPAVELRAIHLVRDARGVAYSWSKEITRPDTPGRRTPMLRLSPLGSGSRWIVQNTLMEALGRRVPVTRMRYETFMAQPADELSRALTRLRVPVEPGALAFLGREAVRLAPNHTVMGNPMRMSTGEVPLVTDDAWKSRLPRGHRLQVTALTLPWLLRYGYRL